MAILSRDEARRIMEKALSFSKADDFEVNLDGSIEGNIRYARNEVSTSGVTDEITLVVQSNFGKKVGVVTTNELTDEALERVVRKSEELAQLSPESPEFMKPMGPQEYDNPVAFHQSMADVKPEYRTNVAGKSIAEAKSKNLTAAGFLEDYSYFSAMMNSNGLFAYHTETGGEFTVTMRSEDGTGSGWAKCDANDLEKFDPIGTSVIAAKKAALSMEPKAIEPGKYTVILEPAASVGLLQNMFYNFGARRADEGRSFLAKEGGGNKIGEQIVDDRVTIYSDPLHPDVPGMTWARDGVPKKKIMMIENGVVKNMFYDRYWANEKGVDPVPFPDGAIMKGGDAGSIEDIIKNTKKGVLVSRTWYIRSVDPQTLLYTGLTRDGTFYVEDGKIQYPVKNFRFNESPIIMLNNLEALGTPVRIDGSLIPPMKVRDFTFTSLSDAI